MAGSKPRKPRQNTKVEQMQAIAEVAINELIRAAQEEAFELAAKVCNPRGCGCQYAVRSLKGGAK